jgi:hypothetical protein
MGKSLVRFVGAFFGPELFRLLAEFGKVLSEQTLTEARRTQGHNLHHGFVYAKVPLQAG